MYLNHSKSPYCAASNVPYSGARNIALNICMHEYVHIVLYTVRRSYCDSTLHNGTLSFSLRSLSNLFWESVQALSFPVLLKRILCVGSTLERQMVWDSAGPIRVVQFKSIEQTIALTYISQLIPSLMGCHNGHDYYYRFF